MIQIGIIGNGFVGKATRLLECSEISCIVYDKNPNLCMPLGTSIQNLMQCDVIFICVPTPSKENGDCDTSIVENVVNSIRSHQCIVCRSTVPIGFCKRMNIQFMPEFLTEKNWKDDFFYTSTWIFGTRDIKINTKLAKIISIAFKQNKIHSNNMAFLSTDEAEALKYFRNTFLATKISYCNEFYQFCKKMDINYDIVRNYACLDVRIGNSHTNVPGHDGKFGFGGTCLPKDTVSLSNQIRNVGCNNILLNSVVLRNETIDRPEKDWQSDIGRAFNPTIYDSVGNSVPSTKWILITGGAGFIGNNLSRVLLAQGEKVIVFDNFCSSDRRGIADLLENPNYKLIDDDICNVKLIRGIKQIYHLACAASPPKYQANPLHTIKTCVVGTGNILEIAKYNNCPILLSSTSEVYGEPTITPQPESYRGNVNTVGIRSCYDEGKRMAETLFFEYRHLYGMDCKIVRIFNTFGPLMTSTDGRVITNFIQQAKNGDDITIYGNGLQTRSFCFIDDLIRGLVSMMNSNEYGPINLGNPNEQTILQVAEKICKLTNSKSKIVFKDLPKDDPTNRCPDITLAKNLLGWGPIVSFEEGISKLF